jgi:hypothetical protein
MKTFKVTLSVEIKLPDEYALATASDESLSLFDGRTHYQPCVEWLELTQDDRFVSWGSVDDDTANMFIDAADGGEEYSIERITV